MKNRLWLPVLVFLLIVLSVLPLNAQQNETTILQLTMHDFLISTPEMRQAVEDFEAANPELRVQMVSFNQVMRQSAEGVNLEVWQSYATQGDVLVVQSDWLSPAVIQADYLLDMEPLVRLETDMPESNAPGAADAFIYDTGRWAVTAGVNPVLLTYDTTAFDAAGLTYPEAGWSLDDLQTWAQALAETGDTAPILLADSVVPLFLQRVIASPVQTVDAITADNMQQTMQTLRDLQRDGLLEIRPPAAGDDFAAPIRIAYPFVTEVSITDKQIPVSLQPQGFAVSKGTQHPEAAYQLARHLATEPEIARLIGGWSIYEAPLSDNPSLEDVRSYLPPEWLPETPQPAINFLHLLQLAVRPGDNAVPEILAQAADRAATQLAEADRRSSESVVVNAPEIRDPADEGVVLRFGVYTRRSPVPSQPAWELILNEFAADDPSVAYVDLQPVYRPEPSISNLAENYDCFYVPYSLVNQTGFNADVVRPITALIASDTTLTEGDFVGQVLDQVSRDGEIWAFPLDVKPLVMWMNNDWVQSMGHEVGTPWTAQEFVSAIRATTQAQIDPSDYVVISYHMRRTHLLLLTYVFGGMPFDYSTRPPTPNFTGQDTLNALQTLISLMDDDVMRYTSQRDAGRSGGLSPVIVAPLDDNYAPNNNFTLSGSEPLEVARRYIGLHQPYLFPRGEQGHTLAYDTGTAYISAETPHPEICYSLLSELSQEPALFASMPARISTLQNGLLEQSRSPEVLAIYEQFIEAAAQPGTMTISSPGFGLTVEHLRQRFFFDALDDAMRTGQSLETLMQNSEAEVNAFHDCLLEESDSLQVSRETLLDCD
jgi:ABC-type glycerol-3-phosphate transport system substrate-binding protein